MGGWEGAAEGPGRQVLEAFSCRWQTWLPDVCEKQIPSLMGWEGQGGTEPQSREAKPAWGRVKILGREGQGQAAAEPVSGRMTWLSEDT